jgi:hypothetical protein
VGTVAIPLAAITTMLTRNKRPLGFVIGCWLAAAVAMILCGWVIGLAEFLWQSTCA